MLGSMLTVAGSSTRRHPKAHARKKASGRVSCRCSISWISGFSFSLLDSADLSSPELSERGSMVEGEGSEGCPIGTTSRGGPEGSSGWGTRGAVDVDDGRADAGAGAFALFLFEGITTEVAGFSPSSGAILDSRN